MSLRRLAEHQPAGFAFSAENAAWCEEQMKKYPPGRQSSALPSSVATFPAGPPAATLVTLPVAEPGGGFSLRRF